MKKIIESTEAEGLESLLGEHVLIWCECYIYYGKLVGVNDKDIILKEAAIVYETGSFSEKNLKCREPLNQDLWYIRTAKIEGYGKWPKQ